jgi:CMP-N,N'-diacetyllegionaminic acid synthase
MKIVGIVPARGGSRRLPRKNIADLGGKPLLQWTLEAAQASGIFDKVWVSTEDQEIGTIAHILQPDCWWHRNPKLALDDTPSLAVVKEIAEQTYGDVFILLQPTSPFRSAEDICKAFALLGNGDSVISVTQAPSDLAYEIGFAQRLRNVPNIVVPNGALYLQTRDALERGETWTSGVAYAYSMPKERSLDIDNGQDLEVARMLVSKGIFHA